MDNNPFGSFIVNNMILDCNSKGAKKNAKT